MTWLSTDTVVALRHVAHAASDGDDRPAQLVPERQRRLNALGLPLVPAADVQIRAADARRFDLDHDLVRPRCRYRKLVEDKAWLGFALANGPHRLHSTDLATSAIAAVSEPRFGFPPMTKAIGAARMKTMVRLPPPPWKAKVVEPIELRSAAERRVAIGEAGYNTFLLRSENVFIDLLTDSGTSALSQEQRAAMELGDEAYSGSRSFFRLEQVVRETFGYRYLIPAHQGRGAEHLLALALVRPGTIVPSNLYFTTSRAHVELAGGRWVDVAIAEATDPESRFPFKGNIDLERLEEILDAAAPGEVAYVRQEACLNMAGGPSPSPSRTWPQFGS